MSRDDQEALAERFFSSPYGRALRDATRRWLLDVTILGVLTRGDDPLSWSPGTIEACIDELLRCTELDLEARRQTPDLLRAFVGYVHAERGVSSLLTEQTLDAVDRCVPAFMHEAHLRDSPSWCWDVPWSWSYERDELDKLRQDVGSERALRSLDAEPLPDEPFDWATVPTHVEDRARDVMAIVDSACDDLFDVELRTAARRLSRRALAGDAGVFARKGRPEMAAAALVWIVATTNGAFSRDGVRVKDFMAHLGLQGSPSQRAAAFLRAAGIRPCRYDGLPLGDPSLLVSARRRLILDRRDRCDLALLALDDE